MENCAAPSVFACGESTSPARGEANFLCKIVGGGVLDAPRICRGTVRAVGDAGPYTQFSCAGPWLSLWESWQPKAD